MSCPYASISHSVKDGEIRATLVGGLTAEAGPLLASLADYLAGAAVPMDVRLDISEVSFVRSDGLTALLALHQAAVAAGVTLRIVGSSAAATELLSQAGLASLLYSGP